MRVEILHKHITMARKKIRERIGERSIYIKRKYGRYFIYVHNVTEKQQKNRDIFTRAQELAKEDLKTWNRRRHWNRLAKLHKIKGGRRMAISFFCKMLRECEGDIEEAKVRTNRACMKVIWNEAISDKESTEERIWGKNLYLPYDRNGILTMRMLV